MCVIVIPFSGTASSLTSKSPLSALTSKAHGSLSCEPTSLPGSGFNARLVPFDIKLRASMVLELYHLLEHPRHLSYIKKAVAWTTRPLQRSRACYRLHLRNIPSSANKLLQLDTLDALRNSAVHIVMGNILLPSPQQFLKLRSYCMIYLLLFDVLSRLCFSNPIPISMTLWEQTEYGVSWSARRRFSVLG